MTTSQRPRLYPYTQHSSTSSTQQTSSPNTTHLSNTATFSFLPLTLYDTPNASGRVPSYTDSLQRAIIDTCKGHITSQRLREMLAAAQLAGVNIVKLKAAEDDSLALDILQDTLDQARRSLREEGSWSCGGDV